MMRLLTEQHHCFLTLHLKDTSLHQNELTIILSIISKAQIPHENG